MAGARGCGLRGDDRRRAGPYPSGGWCDATGRYNRDIRAALHPAVLPRSEICVQDRQDPVSAALQRRVAVLDGEPGQLRIVPEPELLQHVTAMRIDGLDTDLEVLGDLAIGHATREHLHDLLFTRREGTGGVAVTRPE